MNSTKNKAYLLVIFVLMSIGVMSYDESDFKKTPPSAVKSPPKISQPQNSLNKKSVPPEILSLNTQPTYNTKHGNIEENLFGRFMDDRAKFYIIKEPENRLFSSSIKSIKLVYLDNELYNTKYELDSNIIQELEREYGAFTITGFDFVNRDLIAAFELTYPSKSKLSLVNTLNNYQLVWNLKDANIIYRVNTTNNQSIFEYTKRRKDYKIKLWIMEHGL